MIATCSLNNKRRKHIKVLSSFFIFLLLLLLSFLLGYNKGYDKGLSVGLTKVLKEQSSYSNPTVETSISRQWKETKDQPDLILDHHYTATIDGTKVTIPVTGSNIKGTLESPSNVTTKVHQEIDVSPLLKDYEHTRVWEVGTGLGRNHKDWYIPIEVQRNLSSTRALSFQVNVDPEGGKVSGYQIGYKIKF